MDKLDFLDGEQSPADDTSPAVEAAPAPDTSDAGPIRDDQGRFAPKADAQPEPAPAELQQPAPEPAQPAIPAGYVPLAAVEDERQKRQRLERDYQAAQERLRQFESPPPSPDDPDFPAYQQQLVDQRIYATNLNWSRRIAEMQHTPQVVSQAHEWGFQRCNDDPLFNAKVAQSPDPYGLIVEEWKREQLLSQVRDPADIDAFLAWKASQGAQQPAAGQPATASPTPPSNPTPRPSLASLPSGGGPQSGVPKGPGAAFDDVFK